MSETLSGAQILCRTLVEEGVQYLFGYPGGAIMPFYHALGDSPELRHILVRHEQAAAHAADGYARASGRVGVCVATSGPGATNLVTGLATAHMDSSPVLAITGQVSRPMIGRDAFQETDVIGITLPITKASWLVEDAAELADAVREAIAVALDGRPGPVLVDVPKDVQNQKAEYRASQDPRAGARGQSLTPGASPGLEHGVAEAARLIAAAQRPLLMVGHGVILADAYAEIRALAERTGIPVITTLLGISAFPECHPLHLGMPGMHGEVHVNRAIQHADLIVGVGLRFDVRVTGNTAAFAPRAQIVHVDGASAEIGKNVKAAVGIAGDAREVSRRLIEAVAPRRCDAWWEEIRGYMRVRDESWRDGLSPEAICRALFAVTGEHCTVVTDVGQHQMWVAKLFPYRPPYSHVASGGLGRVGLAVPAANGGPRGRTGEAAWAGIGRGGHLSGAVAEPTHALSVLLDDDVFALNRAVGVVRRRNLPIASIAVGPSHIPGASRLTVMMQTDDAGADRMVKQLQKTYGVRGAELLRAADAVAREVALVRVHAPVQVHQELTEVAELFKAELVDEGPDVFVLQVTGAAWFILSFIRALERFGIIEVARSGAVAVRSAAPASRPSTSAAGTVL